MGNRITDFFRSDYMPHGHCYLWKSDILWLNVLSDLFIGFAYFSIPLLLYYFIRKRSDLEFRGIFILFSLFITCCGITHLYSIFVVWHGSYGVHGLLKLATALASIVTAFYVYKSIPLALKLPSPSTLKLVQDKANDEKLQRIEIENQREHDRLLRESTDSAHIGILVCDASGHVKMANSTICLMFGYKQKDIEGKSINILVNDDQNSKNQAFVEAFFTDKNKGGPMFTERLLKGRHKNGREIPIEITLKPGFNGEESIVYVSIIDISEKLIAKDKLIDSNNRFERITTAAEEGLWEYDINAQSVWLSSRFFNLLGYEHQEQEHSIENWLNLVYEEHRATLKDFIFNSKPINRSQKFNFQLRHKDGDYRWFSINAGDTRDSEERLLFRSGTVFEIHKRKVLEKKLVEQETKYRSIVNQLPLGIHIFSINSNDEIIFSDSNPAADKILKIDNSVLHGLKYEEAFPATTNTELPQVLMQVAIEGGSITRETISYTDDNISGIYSVIYCQLTPGTAMIVFDDVSAKRLAEIALEEKERFISRALNTSFAGLYIYNFETSANEFINDAYTRILGYTMADIENMGIEAFGACFHPDDLPLILEHMSKLKNCKTAGQVFDIEYRFKHRGGDWIWCLSKDSPFDFNDNGEVNRFIGSFLDITDIKKDQEKLQQLLRKHHLVMEGSNDGFWHWLDPERDIVEWSDSLYKLLGYEAQELNPSYKHFDTILHPDDRKKTNDAIANAIETRQFFDLEYRIQHKQGDYRWYRGRGTPYFDEDGGLIEMAGSLSDIHQTKELQQDLIRSNKELEQFSFIASHDLKEPLRTIRTFVDYLLQDVKRGKQERIDEDAHYINSACARMSNLIDDLLRLSRAGATQLSLVDCDLNAVIEEVERRLELRIVETGASITILKALPSVLGDQVQLELIFQNLIQNALKFQRSGVAPEIEIGMDKTRETSSQTVIYIQDNGIGIPNNQLKEVFGVFKKLHSDEAYQGTGIGLAIVEKITKRLNGTIHIESIEGQGTTIYIALPKA